MPHLHHVTDRVSVRALWQQPEEGLEIDRIELFRRHELPVDRPQLVLQFHHATGEESVDRNGGQIPPFSETMAYVPRVLKVYRMLIEQPRST